MGWKRYEKVGRFCRRLPSSGVFAIRRGVRASFSSVNSALQSDKAGLKKLAGFGVDLAGVGVV
jgi:hypothetical protein